jgi:hypothetical protein
MEFPIVEVEATFFDVIHNGVSLGVFSAYQIQQAFADDDGFFEFDQVFDQEPGIDGLI